MTTRPSHDPRLRRHRPVRAQITWLSLLLGLSAACDPMFNYRVPDRKGLDRRDHVDTVDCGLPSHGVACHLSSYYFAGGVYVHVDIANATTGKVRIDPARARLSLASGQIISPHRLREAERDVHPPPPPLFGTHAFTPIPLDVFTAELLPGGSMARTIVFPADAVGGVFSSRVKNDWQSIGFALPIDTPEQSRTIEVTFEAWSEADNEDLTTPQIFVYRYNR